LILLKIVSSWRKLLNRKLVLRIDPPETDQNPPLTVLAKRPRHLQTTVRQLVFQRVVFVRPYNSSSYGDELLSIPELGGIGSNPIWNFIWKRAGKDSLV